jgi:ribonuclease HI
MNLFLFEGLFSSPALLVQQVVASREEFVAAKGQATSSNPLTKQVNTRWNKPPLGFIKFNWDASVDHSGKRIGVEVIARDDKGEFCATLTSSMPFICDPEVAEAMAAWRVFTLCEETGVHRAVLERDSLNVVKAINSSEACWRLCGMMVEAMQNRFAQYSGWSVSHTRREANKVAHSLAKHALMVHHEAVWKEVCPPFLQTFVYEDIM